MGKFKDRKISIKMYQVLFGIILSFSFITIFSAQEVFAKVTESDLVKKAANGGLFNCYASYLPAWQIIGTGNGATFNGPANLATSNNGAVAYFPSGTTTKNPLTCKELYAGGGGYRGIFNSGYGVSAPGSSDEAKATFLQKVGYSPDQSAVSKRACIAIKYSVTSYNETGAITAGPTVYSTNRICASLDNSGNIDSDDSVKSEGGGTGNHIMLNVTGGGDVSISTNSGTTSIGYFGNGSWNELVDAIKSQTDGKNFQVGDPAGRHTVYQYTGYDESDPSGGSYVYKYVVNNLAETYKIATNNIFGGDNRTFNKTETISLYQYYLNRYAEDRACTDDEETANALIASGYNATKVRLIKGGRYYNNCYVKGGDTQSLIGIQSSNQLGSSVNINGIIEYLNSTTPEWIGDVLDANIHFPNDENPEETPGTVTNPGDTPSSEEPNANDTTAEDSCYGAAGTIGLGWIMCPILSGISNSLNWVYNNIVRDYLVVETGLTSDSQVYDTWRLFQNISNIILVIFLLVVIFSQLTGIGIDNYGIKKILPRLIICAVLINLSYFIVQFLVDISNIVGNSIAGIFDMSSISITESDYSGLDIPSNILGLGVVTTFGVGVAAVVANPAILLSFLLVILSGLISVLLMWIILIARKAGVVIALVIAPIAFAMYLLPNTSKFTKTWGNLIKGLLLLYPLAALLIGASFFASNLIASLGDGFVLPAMLLRVVPFFALPTLFRKSIDAVGNLGTKIQGFGRGLSRAATGAIRGSDVYKTAQERGLERRTRIRAGLDENGKEQTGWRALLRSRNARNRARYRSQYLKNQAEQQKADMLNDPEYIEAMRQRQLLQDQAERNETSLMNSEDYQKALRAKQDVELEKKQTEAQTSAINTGRFVTSSGAKVDSSSISSLRDALTYEASKDGEQDMSKIMALYNALLGKGDDGIDAIGETWDSGTLKGKGLSRLTEEIAGNGTIKTKARSLHAVANDVMDQSNSLTYDATGGQVKNARVAGTYSGKIKPAMIGDMTDNERNEYINYANRTGDATAMRNIYLASQNINSFKPGEQSAVYNIADKYVQNHMELATTGTYIDKDNKEVKLRRNADNVLVYDDGSDTPVKEVDFKNNNFRLKRN